MLQSLKLKFKKETLFLMAVVFLSLFLRIYKISNNPPSLNWDEVSHGFNAYSVLRTGRDEWGKRFPLIFQAYGDYKLPLYIYLTVIPVKLLGLNPLSVRLVSILSGVGLTMVAYFLTKKLTKNSLAANLAAFLVAVSPWSFFLSRVAVEANLAAFLFSLGFLFILKEKYFLTAFFWGLSLHSYNSARVLAPLMFLFLVLNSIKKRKIKKQILPAIIFILFFIPIILQFLGKSGGARFYWVSPIDQGVINRIIEKRISSSLPKTIVRLIYNRPVYFIGYSIRNYFSHLTANFLFLKGGSHYQFSLPNHGLLYLVTAPFLIIGLIWLIAERKWLLLFWAFASFVPAAITRDSPHVLRSILVLPLPMIFASLGVWQTLEWLKKKSKLGGKLFLSAFIIIVLISFVFWWKNYWQIYRIHYSWSWQYGCKQVIDYAKENYSEYDKIVFTKKYGEPHEFILFYWPWEPEFYQQDPRRVWDYHANWYWVDSFDKFEFWNDWEVKEKLKTTTQNSKLLLITSPGNWPEEGELLKTIEFLDKGKVFEVVEYK